MKKVFLLMSFMAVALTSSAQHAVIDVEPGTKGQLPTVNLPAPAGDKQISDIVVIKNDWEGSNMWKSFWNPEVEIQVIPASKFGGESYSLLVDGKEDRKILGPASIARVYYEGSCTLQLRLNGGPKDGCTSTKVTVQQTDVVTMIGEYRSQPNFYATGLECSAVGAGQIVFTQSSDGNWIYGGVVGSYFRDEYNYRWYRCNPNTYEMTLIEGATSDRYTPTIEDVGYMLYSEATGDGFKVGYIMGPVYLMAKISPEYIGDDGFILNSEYILPDGGQCLGLNNEYDENNTTEAWPKNAVKETAPGQYAFHIPKNKWEKYGIDSYSLAIKGREEILPVFCFDPDITFEAALAMVADRPMQVGVTAFAGKNHIAPLVDVLGRNIDGETVVVASLKQKDIDGDTVYVDLPSNKFRLKLRGGDAGLDTYYPSTVMWSEAQEVRAGMDEETWMPKTFAINQIAKPAPMTGTGIIKGQITTTSPKARTRADGANGYTVYLKVKDGDIIAQTQTDANGNYVFEKVPFGKYEVLVNIEGVTMSSASEVILSASSSSVEGVNYTISGNVITPAENTGIHPVFNSSVSDNWFDLQGRRISQPTNPGLYIQNGKKVVIK